MVSGGTWHIGAGLTPRDLGASCRERGEEMGLPWTLKVKRQSPASEYMREDSENGGHRAGRPSEMRLQPWSDRKRGNGQWFLGRKRRPWTGWP